MIVSDPPPSMNDLMARVGYLFLHWGFLEDRLRSQQRDLSALHAIPGAQEARRIRNLIAHAIVRAVADPTEGAAPHLVCRPTDETEEVRITYEELGDAIAVLEFTRFNIKL